MSVIRPQRQSPVLSAIHRRRSVSPRRLVAPAPGADDIARLAEAALAAPDHGLLQPWRLLWPAPERLADLFEQVLISRHPEAPAERRQREREKATNAPLQLILVARIDAAHPAIPVHEQWIAVGAALQNILLAAEALGYGAKILSGERAADPAVRAGLGLEEKEVVVGYIALGTVAAAPEPRPRPDLRNGLSRWPRLAGDQRAP